MQNGIADSAKERLLSEESEERDEEPPGNDEKQPGSKLHAAFFSAALEETQGNTGHVNSHEDARASSVSSILENGFDIEEGAGGSSKQKEEEEKPKIKDLNIRRLLGEAKPETCILIFGIIALFCSAICNLAIPAIFGRIINSITDDKDSSRSRDLKTNVVILVVVAALAGFFTFLRGYLFTYAGERVVARLRRKLFNAIMYQEIAFFDETRVGELLSRISSDTAVLKDAITLNISMGLRWSATVIGGIIYLFIMSWRLTLVMMGVVPVVLLSALVYGRYVKRLTNASQQALASSSEVAEESISCIRTVRSFANEDKQMESFAYYVDETLRLGTKRSLAYGLFVGSFQSLIACSFVAIVYYGGTLVIHGHLSPGVLTSFLLYALVIGGALGGLGSLFGNIMSAIGANQRVFRILDRQPAFPIRGGTTIPGLQGHVKLHNVKFTYPSRRHIKALRNFSLELIPGKITALVGPSGGGKSTVCNLIEGFYHPAEGKVLIDGYDLRELDGSWWRQRVGLVQQEPTLLHCSIRENIKYGTVITSEEEVVGAAKKANAHDFILSFPEGYDTIVGERGIRLSGGQKQRIAIARAILKDPKILLLDEATSALDAESEHLVQQALDRLMGNRTVLIIAHRLSTVRDAASVVVVNKGMVQNQGTHEELMKQSQLYQKLVKRQLQSAENEAEDSS
eukprot:gb/GECG01009699.1/.p1 GENE.gb/GECG01009699.1/~~gb/GECG01009699.1/.p1  ORF type:complete len:684 (+),score=94.48 gb/GECG01009699.1/:1-2052(+)